MSGHIDRLLNGYSDIQIYPDNKLSVSIRSNQR